MAYESKTFGPRIKRINIGPKEEDPSKEKSLSELLTDPGSQKITTAILEASHQDLSEKLVAGATFGEGELKEGETAQQEIITAQKKIERLKSIFKNKRFLDQALGSDPLLKACRSSLGDNMIGELFNDDYLLDLYIKDPATFGLLDQTAETNEKTEELYQRQEKDLDQEFKSFKHCSGFLPSELKTIACQRDLKERAKIINKTIDRHLPIGGIKNFLNKRIQKRIGVSPYAEIRKKDNHRAEITAIAQKVDDLANRIENDLAKDQLGYFQGITNILAQNSDWQAHVLEKSNEALNGRPKIEQEMTYKTAANFLTAEGQERKRNDWKSAKLIIARGTLKDKLIAAGVVDPAILQDDLTENELAAYWNNAGDINATAVDFRGTNLDLSSDNSLDQERDNFLKSSPQSNGFWFKIMKLFFDSILD